MEPLTIAWILGIILTGVFGFVGWIVRGKFTKVEELENRLTKIEVKMDVLGDINNTLNTLRTDIEIIKAKLEK